MAVPTALGLLTALVAEPVDQGVRKRVPHSMRWLGAVAATGLVLGTLAFVGLLCWFALQPALDQAPQYSEQLNSMWRSAAGWARKEGVPFDAAIRNGDVSQYLATMLGALAQQIWRVGGIVLLAGLLMFLALLEAATWREKMHEALKPGTAAKAIDAIDSVQQKLVTYLWVHTLVSLANGVTVWLWLWIMGVPFAALWGFLFYVLHYIPNVGAIIAALPPLVMALISGGASHMLIVGLGLFINEQLTGNLLISIVEGKRLMISPAVTLVALAFWTWMWGLTGAFLTMPLTVAVVTAMSYIPALQPLALLASDTSERRKLLIWRSPEASTKQA